MAGRNEALFKPFLFADQDLRDLVREMRPPAGLLADAAAQLQEGGNPAEAEVMLTSAMIVRPREVGPWHRLLLAAALDARGNTAGATTTLQKLVEHVTDSRLRLWAFTALRRLGAPSESQAPEGVVVEVEAGRGLETLAAYADGKARYLLPSGKRFIWDAPDGRLAPRVAAVIEAAAVALPAGRLPGEPGPATVRATVLAPAGPRAAEIPFDDVAASPIGGLYAAATALLDEILVIAHW